MTKIFCVGEELSKYDLDQVEGLGADIFIYNYHPGSWDGSGFASYRVKGKWGYLYLDHCSCNGPLDGLYPSSEAFTLEELVKITSAHNSYEMEYSKPVMSFIKKRGYK